MHRKVWSIVTWSGFAQQNNHSNCQTFNWISVKKKPKADVHFQNSLNQAQKNLLNDSLFAALEVQALGLKFFGYRHIVQRQLWSDCTDVQADWVFPGCKYHFVGFCCAHCLTYHRCNRASGRPKSVETAVIRGVLSVSCTSYWDFWKQITGHLSAYFHHKEEDRDDSLQQQTELTKMFQKCKQGQKKVYKWVLSFKVPLNNCLVGDARVGNLVCK